ncbi:hypothetical protein KM043_016938 [Ampulex compressa]|nr:hypothetical protein KM043_016938 [Ampulex compressa]
MEEKSNSISFISTPGFCSDCGSILPLLEVKSGVICYGCDRNWSAEAFGNMAETYILNFNGSRKTYARSRQKDGDEGDMDGPVVERKCPKCQCDKMSYATLQLRSADEGQTVFYTCIQCKYKETENS